MGSTGVDAVTSRTVPPASRADRYRPSSSSSSSRRGPDGSRTSSSTSRVSACPPYGVAESAIGGEAMSGLPPASVRQPGTSTSTRSASTGSSAPAPSAPSG